MNQFPQPTRPINSYNFVPVNMDCNLDSTEEMFQFQSLDTSIPQSTARATEEEEKQAIEDLLRIVSEWHEKLPESIKGTINLEELNTATRGVKGGVQEIVHNFERFREMTASWNSSRGLDGPEEELVEGLERFKIRTVNLGGVVKEEEEKR
ncbi:hypothetical protein SLEP1_g11343 [Rubroshorea leprosula]|uniref:Uncharacterized protein n=1 Tax=Rubroshorea leprosula TaxID=152421 RepID=A0AAV5IL36_9ROSI|nr:hypothetical protein SLEP1_g11343 [Rubroshorea leprosula]